MDESLLFALNGLRSPWLDAVVAPLSRWGIYAFPLLMLLALRAPDRVAQARSIRDGWLTWYLATTLTETILKPILARPRPTATEAMRGALDVLGSVPPPSSLSFPSGTATAAFAGATWIALRWGRVPGGLALGLATVVGLSRVVGGVHWPSDILAGALVGAAAAFGLDRVSRRLSPVD